MSNIETTERKRIILYFPKYTHQPLEAIVCERAIRVAELNMPVISFNHLFFSTCKGLYEVYPGKSTLLGRGRIQKWERKMFIL